MTAAWCVRADAGRYAQACRAQSCIGIGFSPLPDLSRVKHRDELYPLYSAAYPDETSKEVIGQQVGQVARFLLEIQPGDVVVMPDSNTDLLWHGIIAPEPYLYRPGDPSLRYPHRRKVIWAEAPLRRSSLSVPLQNTLRSSLSVFGISPPEEMLRACGRGDALPRAAPAAAFEPYGAVIAHILRLDAQEFEILVGHLLTALGFEGSEVTGRSGDGGVDATGDLNVAGLVKVKLFVQAKRCKPEARISAETVKALRANIPKDGQGAFITTADYQAKAHEVATDPVHPRIGLINGRQLVDLLIEHWSAIPPEFQQRLGLKAGLVPA